MAEVGENQSTARNTAVELGILVGVPHGGAPPTKTSPLTLTCEDAGPLESEGGWRGAHGMHTHRPIQLREVRVLGGRPHAQLHDPANISVNPCERRSAHTRTYVRRVPRDEYHVVLVQPPTVYTPTLTTMRV